MRSRLSSADVSLLIPSSGGIGKYGGQEWRKAFLLRLEGAVATDD